MAVARHLPASRSRAGDRHLKIHDYRDNLRRSTKRNFTSEHFNSFATSKQQREKYLEHQWSKIESTAVHTTRNITRTALDGDQRAAVCELFAMHLVRSRPFRMVHREVLDQVAGDYIARADEDEELRAHFVAEYGRDPEPGDYTSLVEQIVAKREQDNTFFATRMSESHNTLVQQFASHHVQIIESPASMPGFILPDVPVLHADPPTKRYGFRDRLAVGDATLIMAPLTRHTLACFTAKPLPHQVATTKKFVQVLNAALWRNADRELACHPDDAREARRVFDNLDRLPISKVFQPR